MRPLQGSTETRLLGWAEGPGTGPWGTAPLDLTQRLQEVDSRLMCLCYILQLGMIYNDLKLNI